MDDSLTRVLFFADIFGKPGRRAIKAALPALRQRFQPDFVIGNVENLAGGRGVNRKTLAEVLSLGFHCLTSGNHIWDNKEVYSILETENRLLRPLNYPDGLGDDKCPGRGVNTFESNGKRLTVLNVMGRLFMDPVDCPFNTVARFLSSFDGSSPLLVDMHADATSEKNAMGWYLDGRAAAVVGSHSHVQTADERILPKGTAYITDVGMTGSFDSVIGLSPPEVIRKFMTKRPQNAQAAKANPGVACVLITIGPGQKAMSIERLRYTIDTPDLEVEKDLE